MNLRTLHKVYAAAIFIISLIVYFSTAQPSVSFWDCGEFIAASFYMQVPHPPGAPFFLILGNVFSKIPFFSNIGFRVNLISVLSSAFAVFFLYLVAVKLINNYKGRKPETMFEASRRRSLTRRARTTGAGRSGSLSSNRCTSGATSTW